MKSVICASGSRFRRIKRYSALKYNRPLETTLDKNDSKHFYHLCLHLLWIVREILLEHSGP
jgi:hypothetical protein